eukprot:1138316-Pelagomonas_calceolata.AAC.8
MTDDARQGSICWRHQLRAEHRVQGRWGWDARVVLAPIPRVLRSFGGWCLLVAAAVLMRACKTAGAHNAAPLLWTRSQHDHSMITA